LRGQGQAKQIMALCSLLIVLSSLSGLLSHLVTLGVPHRRCPPPHGGFPWPHSEEDRSVHGCCVTGCQRPSYEQSPGSCCCSSRACS
jgi:hypothetical protein